MAEVDDGAERRNGRFDSAAMIRSSKDPDLIKFDAWVFATAIDYSLHIQRELTISTGEGVK